MPLPPVFAYVSGLLWCGSYPGATLADFDYKVPGVVLISFVTAVRKGGFMKNTANHWIFADVWFVLVSMPERLEHEIFCLGFLGTIYNRRSGQAPAYIASEVGKYLIRLTLTMEALPFFISGVLGKIVAAKTSTGLSINRKFRTSFCVTNIGSKHSWLGTGLT